jgi:hypothetical protein
MAELQGTNVAASIVPFTTEDTYPTHESTYGKGGWHEKATIEDRNAIPLKRRSLGMAVYVLSERKLFILEKTLTDDGWVEKSFGSSVSVETAIDEHNLDPNAHKELFEKNKLAWTDI